MLRKFAIFMGLIITVVCSTNAMAMATCGIEEVSGSVTKSHLFENEDGKNDNKAYACGIACDNNDIVIVEAEGYHGADKFDALSVFKCNGSTKEWETYTITEQCPDDDDEKYCSDADPEADCIVREPGGFCADGRVHQSTYSWYGQEFNHSPCKCTAAVTQRHKRLFCEKWYKDYEQKCKDTGGTWVGTLTLEYRTTWAEMCFGKDAWDDRNNIGSICNCGNKGKVNWYTCGGVGDACVAADLPRYATAGHYIERTAGEIKCAATACKTGTYLVRNEQGKSQGWCRAGTDPYKPQDESNNGDKGASGTTGNNGGTGNKTPCEAGTAGYVIYNNQCVTTADRDRLVSAAQSASRSAIEGATSVIDASLNAMDKSVWITEDGGFNTKRLAADLGASVVLGTTGGVITGVVMKKKQVEKGFEALNCTVGGQPVAGWGDEFIIRGPNR